MAICWPDKRNLEKDLERCVSLIHMYSEATDSRDKEIPKAQLYHLITALIELHLWGEDTAFSRIYNIHGAIPMVNYVEDSKRRKTTLPEAIALYSNPGMIETAKKGNNTFFRMRRVREHNQRHWTSDEERIICEIISLRKQFGGQTYAILGLSKPSSLKSSISWLEKQTIDCLKKCTRAVESKGKSETNRRLRDCAKYVKSALDKIEAYRKICPQMMEHLEKKGIELSIDLSFPDLKVLEKEVRVKREEISELRHIAFFTFGIGRPDRDRSHITDIGKLDETDVSDFFEYVELSLSKEEVHSLERYLEIQVKEASSEFDKNIFKVLLAMARKVGYDE